LLTEDDQVQGTFYESELQIVRKDVDSLFRVEKILKKRRRNGRGEVLVTWLCWPKKFNSWILKEDLADM
jgi:hypothetical protein